MFNYFESNDEDFNYLLEIAGKDILINNTPAKAVITNRNLSVTIDYDDRNISTLESIKRGDVIDYNDNKYFVITETVAPRYSKYKSIMRNTNYSIKFVIDGILHENISIIETKTLDVDNGQVISMPTGKIMVTLQENEITNNIQIDQRFIKMGSPWKIVGIDKSKKGLIRLTCDIDVFLPGDDVENEIANADQLIIYVVDITNNDGTINLGDTLQLNVVVTANGEVVAETILFESSNETVATVSTNGLVTTLSEGNVTITARLEKDTNVFDVIQLTIAEAIGDNFSIVIDGSAEIKYDQTQTYTVTVYNNAQQVNETVTFALYADDQSSSTTLASITSQDGYSCVIKNNQANSGYVQLKAILDIDNTVIELKRIQMKPLF